jgi:hypothetical protein
VSCLQSCGVSERSARAVVVACGFIIERIFVNTEDKESIFYSKTVIESFILKKLEFLNLVHLPLVTFFTSLFSCV